MHGEQRRRSDMPAEMQVFGHAAADAGDADVLIRRTYDHVKLQVCAGRPALIVETSKIADFNLCTLAGCRGFSVRRRHAPARVQLIITKESSRREIDGVSKKVQ